MQSYFKILLITLLRCGEITSEEVTCASIKRIYQEETADGSCCSGKLSLGELTCTDPVEDRVDVMQKHIDLLKARSYSTDGNDTFSGVYQGFASHISIIAQSPLDPSKYHLYELASEPTIAKGFEFDSELSTLKVEGLPEQLLLGGPNIFIDEEKTILSDPYLTLRKRVKKPSDFPNPKNWFEEYLTTMQFETNRIDTLADPLISIRDNWERLRYTFQMNTIETQYRELLTGDIYGGQRFQKTGYDLTALHRNLGYRGVTNEMNQCKFSKAVTGHVGRLVRVSCPIGHMINQGMIPVNLYSKIHVRGTGTELDDMPYLRISSFDKQHAFATLKNTAVRNRDEFYVYLRMPLKLTESTLTMSLSSDLTGDENVTLTINGGYYYPQDMLEALNTEFSRKTNVHGYFEFVGSMESPSKNQFVFTGGSADVSHNFMSSSGPLFEMLKGFPLACQDKAESGSLQFNGTYGSFTCALWDANSGACAVAPAYLNDANVSAAQACCACGGGVEVTDTVNLGLNPTLHTPMSLTDDAYGSIEYTHGPAAGALDPSDVLAAYIDLFVRTPELHSITTLLESFKVCNDGYGELSTPSTWVAWKRGCQNSDVGGQKFHAEVWNLLSESIHAAPTNVDDIAAAAIMLQRGKPMQLAFNDEQRQYLKSAKGFTPRNYLVDGGYYLIKTEFGSYEFFPISGDMTELNTPPLISGSTFGIIRPEIMHKFGHPDEVVGVFNYRSNALSTSEYDVLGTVVLPFFKKHNVTQLIVDERGNPGGYSNPDALLVGGDEPFQGKMDIWRILQDRGGLVGDVVDIVSTDGRMRRLGDLNTSFPGFFDTESLENGAYYDQDDDMYYPKSSGVSGNGGVLPNKLQGTPSKKLNMVMLFDPTSTSASQAIKNLMNSFVDPVTGEYPDGSNVRGCSVGEEPHLFGTGSTGFFRGFVDDLYPYEPQRRSQDVAYVGGKERVFTDDFHHKYNKVDATVSSSYENFMTGIGLVADAHISGVEFTNVSSWRDLALEKAIRAAVSGCESVIASSDTFDDITTLPNMLDPAPSVPPFPPPSPKPPAFPPSPPPPPCLGTQPTVTIYIGTWGEDNAVRLDLGTESMWQSPVYTNSNNGETLEYSLCLPAGTYTAVLLDAYGDGWTENGYVEITDLAGQVLEKTYMPSGSKKIVEFELKMAPV